MVDMNKWILTVLILTTLLPVRGLTQSHAETNAAEQEVRSAEEARRQAILHNDMKLLDSLLAPDYTAIFQINGSRVQTRDVELTNDQAGSRKVESCEPSEVTVRIYDNVGLVTGLADDIDSNFRGGGRRHVRFRYTHVWVKRNGNWQLVHRHTTRVATIEGSAPPR